MTETQSTDFTPSDTAKPAVSADLLAQMEATLWLPHEMNEEEKAGRIGAARARLEAMQPARASKSCWAARWWRRMWRP